MMTKLGLYSVLAGLFVGLFSGISNFMGARNFWVDLTLSKIIGPDTSESIAGFFDIDVIQNAFTFLLYNLPFFFFLLGLGCILLIISSFVKPH